MISVSVYLNINALWQVIRTAGRYFFTVQIVKNRSGVGGIGVVFFVYTLYTGRSVERIINRLALATGVYSFYPYGVGTGT